MQTLLQKDAPPLPVSLMPGHSQPLISWRLQGLTGEPLSRPEAAAALSGKAVCGFPVRKRGRL
jgi:hypothetical protein